MSSSQSKNGQNSTTQTGQAMQQQERQTDQQQRQTGTTTRSGLSQEVSGVQQSSVNDPTIELFNRFVAKDTHCLLGKTGIKLSRVCLGTMNFGRLSSNTFGERPGQLSESEAHKILDRFVELGGNCIDTADFFPWFGSDVGKSEQILGNWLSK